MKKMIRGKMPESVISGKLALLCALYAFFIILSGGVTSGFALAPASKTFAYEPHLDISGRLRIININREELALVFAVEGPLAEYVELEKRNLTMKSTDSSAALGYRLRLSGAYLAPGTHNARIIVSSSGLDNPSAGQDEGAMEVELSLESAVRVEVPFPGTHVESHVSVDYRPDSSYVISVPARNIGDTKISSAYVLVDVYSPTGKIVDMLETEQAPIEPTEQKVFHAFYRQQTDTGPVSGIVANLIFDGNMISMSHELPLSGKQEAAAASKSFPIKRVIYAGSIALLCLGIVFQYLIIRSKVNKKSGKKQKKVGER